jgi:hypothetical protein
MGRGATRNQQQQTSTASKALSSTEPSGHCLLEFQPKFLINLAFENDLFH